MSDPNEPDVERLYAEGEVFLGFKLFAKAREKFEAVLHIDPDHPKARLVLRLCGVGVDENMIPMLIRDAEILVTRGETRDASRLLRTVASDLYHLGRHADRMKVLARIWHLVPEDVVLARELAAHELAHGDPRRALTFLQPSFKHDPHDPDTLVAVACCFEAIGKAENASRCFAEAARLVEQKGDHAAAAVLAGRARALFPTSNDS